MYGLNPGLLLPAITKSEPSVINEVEASSDSDDKFDPLLTETVFYPNPVSSPPPAPSSAKEADAKPKPVTQSFTSIRGGRRGRRGGKRPSSMSSRQIAGQPPEPKRPPCKPHHRLWRNHLHPSPFQRRPQNRVLLLFPLPVLLLLPLAWGQEKAEFCAPLHIRRGFTLLFSSRLRNRLRMQQHHRRRRHH